MRFELRQVKTLWQQVTLMVGAWWLPLLFVWTFMFAGVITLGFGITSSLEAFYSRSWPTVEGKITISQVDSYLTESDSSPTRMFHAQVNFAYSVAGKVYSSDLVNLGDFSTSERADAEQISARYPLDASVRVYYDPGNPEKAVLEPGPTAGLLIPLIVGAVVSLLGFVMTCLLMRKILGKTKKKRKPND